MSTVAVWFRHDLRCLDHRALSAACEAADSVRAVYFLCPEQLDEHVIAPIRRHYLRRALDELATQLATLGIELDIVNAGHFRALPQALSAYADKFQLEAVYAHKEWLVDEIARDEACQQALNGKLQLIDDSLINPLALSKDDGDPYKVFTPFSKRCRTYLQQQFPRCLRRPTTKGVSVIPSQCPVFGDEKPSTDWPVTEEAVLNQLRTFCAERAEDYQEQRDFPAEQGTSTLSPALALGIISPRQCLARLQAEAGEQIWEAKSGPGCWFNELLWREFYRHIAFHFPRVVKGKAFQPHTDKVAWRYDQKDFDAWREGNTGYPIVDAAMRQLKETGWMHNRLRMISASFLCKDLHIDWRWGEKHFLETLVDADFASNNGGWQWAASTGTDAAPYFRIFNPTTQGQRFDPDGRFILRYVPELNALSGKALHQPPAMDHYPAQIVDHAVARKISLALFQNLAD
ncbi:deoxyribodipyrimidine photolyase [Spongiibacter sp. IMCC21906]|uniref:deoxyribodipyrimidine photo-lyase n=1 Tax=Spongiibacter sp. IMCC21906 TaxID=1620392 RepID=UPI00062DFCE3|nr:deoxyribodipyrimidine photo-lyase [Spongiibacter sp. IMCC21906]AKH68195.1 deoxyribodipyrimidine photolyase [Spongiibacter sp. IMCC21906]